MTPDSETTPDDIALQTHTVTGHVLAEVQRWLGGERTPGSRLAVVTRRAIATGDGELIGEPVQAAVWGLIRTAQNEHPGHLVLIDVDDADADLDAALASGEPQVALRGGEILIPNLVRTTVDPAAEAPALDPDGTVLITGATGSLGALFARHLVTRYGARRLLLVSRRGLAAPGAEQLRDELTGLGADVSFAAADIAELDQARELLDAIPAEHPLTAVVHTAGVLDDATVSSLTGERLDAVLRPKVDAAWHLHELTRHHDLALFALFSSVAGIIGNPGQANYAAANTFLDALADHRRGTGLRATSLAWGLWDAGMGDNLSAAEKSRLARGGITPLDAERGTALFDLAVSDSRSVLVPAGLDLPALRVRAREGSASPLLRGLLKVRRSSGGSGGGGGTGSAAGLSVPALPGQLAGRRPEEQHEILQDFVRGTVAAVLGHADPAAVEADRGLFDLGFDSLTVVELRNRLVAATGLALPTSFIFDYPTAAALAGHLRAELAAAEPGAQSPAEAVRDGLARLEEAFAVLPAGDDSLDPLLDRLQLVLDTRRRSAVPVGARADVPGSRAADADAAVAALGSATDDEIFAFIDREL